MKRFDNSPVQGTSNRKGSPQGSLFYLIHWTEERFTRWSAAEAGLRPKVLKYKKLLQKRGFLYLMPRLEETCLHSVSAVKKSFPVELQASTGNSAKGTSYRHAELVSASRIGLVQILRSIENKPHPSDRFFVHPSIGGT